MAHEQRWEALELTAEFVEVRVDSGSNADSTFLRRRRLPVDLYRDMGCVAQFLKYRERYRESRTHDLVHELTDLAERAIVEGGLQLYISHQTISEKGRVEAKADPRKESHSFDDSQSARGSERESGVANHDREAEHLAEQAPTRQEDLIVDRKGYSLALTA